MRGIISVWLVCVCCLATGCGSVDAPEASFKGRIAGTNAIVVTKVADLNRNRAEVITRIDVAADGSFDRSFDDLVPHLYELNFQNGEKLQFVTDGNESIEFTGDAANPDSIKISGSRENDKFLAYEEFRKESLERLVKSVRAEIKAFPDKTSPEFNRLGKLEAVNYSKHKDELFEYASKNLGTSFAQYPASIRWPANPKIIEPLVASFEKAYPNLEMTKRMREKLALIEQTSVGGTAPDIKMRDETGNEISLNESRGKYTLIDFWGSWCGPCRREAGTLSGLYQKYRGEGFEIFGVGLESELQKWKEAKKKDQRIWKNVLSLTEFETEAAYDYGITALPANFLIDADGKIIARDIHDEDLEAKLAEIF